MATNPQPTSIIFFRNGLAAVCCGQEQMPEFQRGNHDEVIARLEAAGIDWRTLQVTGYPLKPHEYRNVLGKPIS